MNKREFLKTSAMTAASTAIPSSLLAAGDGDIPRENWAGNYHYSTNKVLQPSTLAETQDAVRSVSQVRALGTRHCFNGIADSTVAQISTLRLNSFHVNAAGRRSRWVPVSSTATSRCSSTEQALRCITWRASAYLGCGIDCHGDARFGVAQWQSRDGGEWAGGGCGGRFGAQR